MIKTRHAFMILAIAGTFSSVGNTAPDAGPFDPQATQILKQASEFLISARALRTQMAIEFRMSAKGMKQQMTSEYTLAVQKPNKLAMVQTEGIMGSTTVCDGKKLYVLIAALQKYVVDEAPADLSQLGAQTFQPGMMGELSTIAPQLAKDPYKAFMEDVTEARYVGTETVDGTSCHHLRFVQAQFDWDIWLTDGDQPLPAKVAFDMSKAMRLAGQDLPGGTDAKLEKTVRYGKWQVNTDLPEDLFKFTPPPGTEKVDSFFEGMTEDAEQHPLLGRTAPGFQARLLGGGKLDLLKDQGERIVVLDFWATWCPPCMEALPELAKLSEQYKDKEVLFCLINQGEDPEVIRRTLKSLNVDVTVALDPRETIGRKYRVEGIPQTVVIGKDGTVQAVHVGYMSGLDKILAKQLDALRQGEKLAEKPEDRELVVEAEPWADETGEFRRPSGARQIPAGPDAPTSKIYTDTEAKLSERQILQAYKNIGKRSPKWDKPALDFLRLIVGSFTSSYVQSNWEKATKLAKAALDAGCDDPMVQFWYAHTQEKLGRLPDAERRFRLAKEGFKGSGYSVSYVAWSIGRVLELLKLQQKPVRLKQFESDLMAELAEAVGNGGFKPSERRVLLHYLQGELEELSAQERLEFSERIEKLDGTDPWIVHMIAGRAHVDLAWEARGRGWASSVTEEGWKGFEDHLVVARGHLTKAWELAPDTPEPADKMITVAMAGHAEPGQTPRFWFDRAVPAQLDYLPAYNKLRWATRPRWGGSHSEMYNFGLECAATKRYDTWVPAELFWAVHNIADDLDDDWEEVLHRPRVYENIQRMLDGYVSAKDARPGQGWALSMKAAVAYRAKRWQDARKALETVGAAVQKVAFDNVGAEMVWAVPETYARTDPHVGVLEQAEDHLDREEYALAVPLFRRLLRESKEGSPKLPYLRLRAWEAERLTAFHEGKWVDIMPGEDLIGWRVVEGKWTRHESGAVEGTPLGRGIRLVCRAPFVKDLEIKGALEFVHGPYKPTNISIVIGPPDQMWWHSVMVFYKEKKILADFKKRRLSHSKPVSGIEAPVKKKNDFHIKINNERLTLHLNGKCVVQDKRIEDWSGGDHPTIAIAGYYGYPGDRLQFSDLMVRKLTQSPESPGDDF